MQYSWCATRNFSATSSVVHIYVCNYSELTRPSICFPAIFLSLQREFNAVNVYRSNSMEPLMLFLRYVESGFVLQLNLAVVVRSKKVLDFCYR